MQAKRARKLYHSVGAPTVENFKHMLRSNIIKDCPVTVKDVNIAEKIFGPDVGTLKGKTTRRKPNAVKEDQIEIPPELIAEPDDLVYCMDLFYVNGMPMMNGIDKTIRYRKVVPLKNRTAESLYNGIDKVLRDYNKAGMRIKVMRCDNEFRTLMDEVSDEMDIEMEYAAPGEHQPEAERNNRLVGERIRVAYHRLPFKAMPKLMLRYLAMTAAEQLNYFPVKGGVSAHFSPHQLIKRRNISFKQECAVPFGTYVQAYEDHKIKNDNKARTIDAIYLRAQSKNGHELMNLETGELITRGRIWEVPITSLVIRAVEEMAYNQGIKSLKVTGKNKVPLLPANWVAGVDHDQDLEDGEDEDYMPMEDDLNDDDNDDMNADNIEQDEIDDLVREDKQEDTNPTDRNDEEDNNNNAQVEEQEQPEQVNQPELQNPEQVQAETVTDDEESQAQETRTRRQPERYTYPREHMGSGQANMQREVAPEDDTIPELEMVHNLIANDLKELWTEEYEEHLALMIGRVIVGINQGVQQKSGGIKESFAQQYILKKGMEIFKKDGEAAAYKELEQLHNRACFTPIDVSTLSPTERKKCVDALMFLSEKRDGTVKGRMVYNGKPTRDWISREEVASPTVSSESVFVTAGVDAKEERDVMSTDIPNAFIQAKLKQEGKGDERVIMKITGVLVDILVKLAPEIYAKHVVYEKGKRVLYVEVIQALYGMLVAAILWYKEFRTSLESIGFMFNPYDPCVANRTVKRHQHTVRFHVDDLKSSHKFASVNTNFLRWLNEKYGKYGKVVATRGKVHDYLGMTFDYRTKGKVKIDMSDYIKKTLDEFKEDYKLDGTAETPAGSDLFNHGSGEELSGKQKSDFHTFVAKGLFACKRARPDIHLAITALSTRVRAPTTDDWKKLIRILKFLNGTKDDVLTLKVDDLHVMRWYVDASFAVHPDFKSHSGGVMTMGEGAMISGSNKQKLNTRSSCEAELVGADDFATKILWTKLFLEAQGYEIKENILYQDNQSTLKLLENGKRSSGKRTRALSIRYFFLHDQAEQGNLKFGYCPTGEMLGDYNTKPLSGMPFKRMRKRLMGMD